jgi:hypothetical protein
MPAVKYATITFIFKKGSQSRWSDKTKTVASFMGKTLALYDGAMHQRDKVLLVLHHSVMNTSMKRK